MKPVLLPLLLITLGLHTYAQDDLEQKHPKTYKAVLKTVNDLPETKDFLLKTAESSKPIVVAEGPSESYHHYWWVKVGISNFDTMRTVFDLLVDPDTLKVYYLDNYMETEEGVGMKLITLQQWRKWRTTPAWNKLHHYKNGKLVALANSYNENKSR